MTDNPLAAKKAGNAIVILDGTPYDDLLQMALDVEEDAVFVSPKCKLCNSTLRLEAEEYCEKSNWNYAQTAKFLNTKGFAITAKPVQNHIEDHYRPWRKRLQVKHYANDVKAYLRVKNDSQALLEFTKGILAKALLETAAEGAAMNPYESRKSNELVVKISAQIVSCINTEQKHTDDMRLAEIVIEKLNQIVEMEQKDSPPEYAQRLNKVVATLIDNLEESKEFK
jgi:hypothetical protein